MKQEKLLEESSDKLFFNQSESMKKIISQLESENEKLKLKVNQLNESTLNLSIQDVENMNSSNRSSNKNNNIQIEQLKYEIDVLQKKLKAQTFHSSQLQEKLELAEEEISKYLQQRLSESERSITQNTSISEKRLTPKSSMTRVHKSPQASPPTPQSPNLLNSFKRTSSSSSNSSVSFQNQIISEESQEVTELHTLKQNKEQLEDEIARITNLNNDLNQQVIELSKTLDDKEYNFNALKLELSKLKYQFESSKQEWQSKNESQSTLKEEQLTLLNGSISNLKEQNKILREENNYLENTISQLKSQIETQQYLIDSKSNDTTTQIDSLLKENSRISDQLEIERNHNLQLAKETSQLTNRLSQYEKQISGLEERFLKEKQFLSLSSQETQQKLINLQNELSEKDEQILFLNTKVEEFEKKATETLSISNKLERERSIMNQTLEDVRTENSLLRSDKKENEREIYQLKNKVELLKQELDSEKKNKLESEASYQQEIRQLLEHKNLIMKELDGLKDHIQEYEQMIAPINELKEENESSNSLLVQYSETIKNLESSISEYSQREQELHNNIQELKNQNSKLAEIIQGLRTEIEENQTSFDNDIKSLQSKNELLVRMLEKNDETNQDLVKQNNVLSMKILQLDHEISGFEESKSLIDSHLSHFKEKLKSLEDEHARKEKQHQEMLDNQRNELELIMDSERREHAKLVLSMREDINNLIKENQRIRKQAHIEVEQELIIMKNRIHQNNETIVDIRKDILFTKTGLNQLQKGLHAMLNALTLQEEKVLKPLRQNSGGQFGDKKRLASAYVNRITQKMGELVSDMDSRSQLLDSKLQLRISTEFNKKLTSRIEDTESKLEKADLTIQELMARLTTTENQYIEAETSRRELEQQVKNSNGKI